MVYVSIYNTIARPKNHSQGGLLAHFVLPAGYSSSVGTRSRPIQNFGGRGRSSRSNFADVAGSVNGSGTAPPKSAVEQDAKSRAHPPPIAYSVDFMTSPFTQGISFVQTFHDQK